MSSGKLLVIGYGNRLRGDDAAGFLAAERLIGFVSSNDIQVLAVHQLTPELADPISRASSVIFIDAAASGQPGEIRKRCVTPRAAAGGFTHHATPEGLLAAASDLYGHAPETTLYSIAAQSFDLAEHLTAPIQAAVDRLVAQLVLQYY